MKFCSRHKLGQCKSPINPQPLENFNKRKAMVLGRTSECKKCFSHYMNNRNFKLSFGKDKNKKGPKAKEPLYRFWRFVETIPFHSCWEWIGGKTTAGYGVFWDGKNHTGAHQFSYRIHKGEIPKGMVTMHNCDNPSCVNPDHLKIGTDKDNTQDCIAKNRHRHGTKRAFKFTKLCAKMNP